MKMDQDPHLLLSIILEKLDQLVEAEREAEVHHLQKEIKTGIKKAGAAFKAQYSSPNRPAITEETQ
ncbi:MAG: hypothetical protein M3261_03600 [Thermoproteota archaeon]|nr:hypothetical protein [Thermoproteota archaeon]